MDDAWERWHEGDDALEQEEEDRHMDRMLQLHNGDRAFQVVAYEVDGDVVQHDEDEDGREHEDFQIHQVAK